MQQADEITIQQAEEDLRYHFLFNQPTTSKWQMFKKIIRIVHNVLLGIILVPFAFFLLISLIF